jgi:uncharacterized protein (DUF736 family)
MDSDSKGGSMESIGALWKKVGKDNNSFLSGKVTVNGVSQDIIIFKNDKGDNDKRPDYRIFASEPRQ